MPDGYIQRIFEVSGLIKAQFESGRIDSVKVRWWRFGPFLCEWHQWWRWRLGVCFGTWYAGLLIGPLVVTFGKRRYIAKPRVWTVTWESLDVKKVG